MSRVGQKAVKKEVRKPISDNFAPKRLAINFQPPTLIMEYLAVDTGKLYHHKMRLDSVFKKTNVNRIDVLNYVKNKHYLYFTNGKVKDAQLLKFIDKIIAKLTKSKNSLTLIKEEAPPSKPATQGNSNFNQDDDFDYLNDDDEYEQDYQDYEEPEDQPPAKPEIKKEVYNPPAVSKNTFLTYCKEYEDSNDEEGGAEWDLDMDEDADFV